MKTHGRAPVIRLARTEVGRCVATFQYLCRIPRACPWMNAGGYFGTLERRWRHDFPVTACIGPSIMWYGYQNTGEGS